MTSLREPNRRVQKKQETSTTTVNAICQHRVRERSSTFWHTSLVPRWRTCIPTTVSGVPSFMVTCLFTSIIPPEQVIKAPTDKTSFIA
jgi:hypothetical protein